MLSLFSLLGVLVVGSAVGMSDFSSLSNDTEDDEKDSPACDGPKESDTAPNLLAGDGTAETISGTDKNDDIDGAGGNDLINGYDGDDEIHGGAGDDTIDGDDGDDDLSGDFGNDEIHAGDGEDTITGDDGNDRLFGENGDDTVRGGDGDDFVVGGDGDDILEGNDGNDTLAGGSGDDVISGGAGEDNIQGGQGDDILSGLDDGGVDIRDFLNGGNGDDTLIVGDADVATGGEGADSFQLNITDTLPIGAQIMDFDSSEDSIVLLLDPFSDEPNEVTVEPDPENADTQMILLDGEVVATVNNAPALTADQISLQLR
ncbi:calcium-binding protein [Halocynthiibacter namhaensis]|uniref:calcium-binding protein n=1 Tax=Halocynthiibacter namhaensis TaxID=1290553 RepID=UPI0005797996|nr:calcium-binding protein [Halocynthiibacter namhaensis]